MDKIKHIKINRDKWDQYYYDNLAEKIRETVHDIIDTDDLKQSKYKVIDIGSGNGEILKSLCALNINLYGVDINYECVKNTSKYGDIRVVDIMDLHKEFKRNYFDIAICSHVLEHIENPKFAMKQIIDVSKQYILIIVPNLARIINWFARKPRQINPGHLHGWDHHHLRTFLELHCNLIIEKWIIDGIYMSPLHKMFPKQLFGLHALEYKILPKIIPQAANSLIVLCKKAKCKSKI